MAELADIGIAGLGAMGRNLALQAADKELAVAAYDGWPEARATWAAAAAGLAEALADPAGLAARLKRPRRILVLLKAGSPTDDFLDALAPSLSPGDVVADLGNAHFRDTERRQRRLAGTGVHLLGIGISGGAAGARTGASFMAGGDAEAWERIAPMVAALAARVEGAPCSAWFGPGGAGHFVKMVHNGIEYAEMQALAECHAALRDGAELDAAAIAQRFERWNQGVGESFLTGLAVRVLRTRAPGGGALVDLVRDEAGQKGTGRWTVEAALELGVPAPTLAEAVFARGLSALAEDRREAAGVLDGPGAATAIAEDALGAALLGTRIAAFAQGFALLAAASETEGWGTDLAAVAEVWRAGCILRGAILPEIAAACREGRPSNLVAAPGLAELLNGLQRPWRDAVAACQAGGIPVPALSSALAYLDGRRSARLGANLIAAQRDAFGAHGFRRIDREGDFHDAWDGGGA